MSRRMRLADAVWYLGENPRNPMMVSSVLWFDRPLDVTALREVVARRMLDRHPVFRERIAPSRVLGRLPRWVEDPAFALDHHVTVTTLPAPGDHASLQDACSRQRSRPLDRAHPLWSVHVFQGYRETGSAMHIRIHHSVGDGLALMRLLLSLTDEAETEPVPIVDPPGMHLGTELVHVAGQSVTGAAHLVRHPGDTPARVREATDLVRWFTRLALPVMAPRSPLIGQPSGTKRMVWDPDGLPLDAVKDAAHRAGATVNDLLLTVLTGAVRHHLEERDALVDDVLVVVPVNLRPPDEPLPRHLGNRIGLLPVLLPTGAADPSERLRRLQERILALKHSPAPPLSRLLLTTTVLLTPPGERAYHRFNQLRGSGVVTNVPGPTRPLHLAGARLDGIIGWGGMTGHLNLSVAFISLAGRVYAGLVSDEGITPDPDALLAGIGREWAALPTTWTTERVAPAR